MLRHRHFNLNKTVCRFTQKYVLIAVWRRLIRRRTVLVIIRSKYLNRSLRLFLLTETLVAKIDDASQSLNKLRADGSICSSEHANDLCRFGISYAREIVSFYGVSDKPRFWHFWVNVRTIQFRPDLRAKCQNTQYRAPPACKNRRNG